MADPAPLFNAAKRHLLLTAERLFAQRGCEGVSLREIAQAAGSRNNNAVQYPFGSREGLMAAIHVCRVGDMEAMREAMLARAGAEGLLGDSLTLLQILCLPHLALKDEDGSHPYAGFLVHYVMRHWRAPDADAAVGAGGVAPAQRRVVELIAATLGDLSPAFIRSRSMLALMLFLNALLRHDHVDRQLGVPALLEDALRSAHAALRQSDAGRAPLLFADMLAL